MADLGALDLGACPGLARLGGNAAVHGEVLGVIGDHHELVCGRVANDHLGGNLKATHQGAGHAAVTDVEGLGAAGLEVELHVVDVAQDLAGAGASVHARPHDALVPVKAKALASGIVKAVVRTGHHNAALAGLKRVPR